MALILKTMASFKGEIMNPVMKRFFWLEIFAFAIATVWWRVAFAADAPIPDSDFWTALLTFLGGVKGMTVMGIAVAVTQILMLFFSTSLSDFAGAYKLVIVTGLTVVATLLGNLVTGNSLVQALLNGATLAAIQVFIHQIYVQFIQKK